MPPHRNWLPQDRGQTHGHSISLFIKLPNETVKQEHQDVAKKVSKCVHKCQLLLLKKMTQMDQILNEALESEIHPYNMNREGGFPLNHAWKPLICNLKEQRQSPTEVISLIQWAIKRADFICPTLPAPPSPTLPSSDIVLESPNCFDSVSASLVPNGPFLETFLLQPYIYGPSESWLITSALWMAIACFSRMLASTNQSTQ
jgi:hypothetical protein